MADGAEISEAEMVIRTDLAACYRLIARFGWDDLIYTHISARVPGEKDQFLINPMGSLFEEVTASSLVKVDFEGNQIGAASQRINKAGFLIHSTILRSRQDIDCAIHLHTHDGVAVSTLECGLLPLNQSSMAMAADVAYHEFKGPELKVEECARLVTSLGNHGAMILRNHGTLAVGRSVAEAFHRMYFLEWSCSTQVRTLSMGQPLHMPSEEAVADTIEQTGSLSDELLGLEWPALLRMLDRQDAGYRS